ncbi:MAG: protease-like activity factor CPAF [Elusimicrobiota bacterium]
MNTALVARMKAFMACTVSFFLITSGSVPAYAGQVISGAVKANVGVRAVPLSLGANNGVLAVTGGSTLSLNGKVSVLPSLSSVAPVLPSAQNRNLAVSPSASVRQVPAAAVQSKTVAKSAAETKGRQGVAVRTQGISREIGAAVKSVGPLAQSSMGAAHGLGGRIMQLLTGGSLTHQKSSGNDFVPFAHDNQNLTKRKMIQTLEYVATIFSEHYAPLDWKREKFGLELKKELDKAKQDINKATHITTRQYQNILARFTNSVRDHHVSIQFYSTEMAKLPLDIAGIGGKHLIVDIDRRVLSKKAFPFEVGDQVVEFGGRPVAEVVAEIRRAKGPKSQLSDTAMAEMFLTRRIRQSGDNVPQGPIQLKVLSQGQLKTVTLQWQYAPEMVPEDVPVRDGANLIENWGEGGGIDSMPALQPELGVFARIQEALKSLIPLALNPLAALLSKADEKSADNPRAIGGRKSFVPDLGEVVWRGPAQGPFHSYIYKNEEGKKVGYIRISDYMQNEQAAELFGQIMQKFEQETESLVIDQVNNPGGNLFYMYALLSRLTDKPLKVPMQRMLTGEEEAYQAAQIINADPMVRTDMDAMRALGPSLAGYPVTLKVWKQFVSYFKFIVKSLKEGKRFTELFSVMGVDEIAPHPTQRYTKPITMLINELDFSCGDFFPAILQDNGRVKLFGTRTSGAGGAVKGIQFPNQFGIAQLAYTYTIAYRANGEPIENLGVQPDKRYAITEADIKDGYSGYRTEVNKVVASQQRAAARQAKKEGVAEDKTKAAPENPGEKPAVEAENPAPANPELARVTAEELKGTGFHTIAGVPQPGMPQATLKVGKDGSWKVESQELWDGAGRSGKDVKVADRREMWGDQDGDLALFGEHGGPIVKLTPDKKAQLKEATGVEYDYMLLFAYGALAEGEWIMMFGSKQ